MIHRPGKVNPQPCFQENPITMVYCWKCGNAVGDDVAFCPKCGASIRTAPTGVQVKTCFELLGSDKGVQNHWARRLIALIIDAVIVSIVLVILAAVVAIPFFIGASFRSGVVFSTWWGTWVGAWFGGLAGAFVFLYFFLAEGLYGRTIGKEAMGLRVERVDGKRVDFRDSLIRNISKIYWVLLLIDVAVGLGTHGEMSQKWSDRYVGTKVEEKTRITIIP